MGKRGALITKEQRQAIQNEIQAACKTGISQQAACKAMGITERTIQRWKKQKIDMRSCAKKTTHNKLSEEEYRKILNVMNSSKFKDQSPSKIVPQLADEGKYLASESTMYRILKREKLLRHRLKSKPKKNHKPKAIKATAPNLVYTWDITYLITNIKGIYYYLYMFMDIYSRKIVGWQVYDRECSVNASDLIKDIYEKENLTKKSIFLHSDNGGPMKGATMLATLQKLGVMPSFSRPGVSNDNPYSESLFKSVKYHSRYPQYPFKSLQDARSWVANFVNWYNHEHLHSGIKFVTPEQRHNNLDVKILENRKNVYLKAKVKNPQRWSKNIRNWDHINYVLLNPEKGKSKEDRSLNGGRS